MKIGYARVSTRDQDLSLQTAALKKAGCERIVNEKASGKTRDRPGLTEVLNLLRKDDILVVWKLDRLGRSLRDLINISTELKERSVELMSLTESIDTSKAAGRLYFSLMATFAEFEREVIRERSLAGVAAARRAGKMSGRPKTMTKEKIDSARTLLKNGASYGAVAKALGVSKTTVYRHCPEKRLVLGR